MSDPNPFRVAIIGGGISGLSAAFHLSEARRRGVNVEEHLFEARARLGGSLRSETIDGCLIETGADSFLSEKLEGREFCKALGLEDQIIGSLDDQRRTWILLDGELVPLPNGLEFIIPARILPFATTPMFDIPDKFRILSEAFRMLRPSAHDESVGDFVERHFGRKMLDVLVDPLLNGVYGADTRKLSVRAVLPRLVEMERRYGSLLLGMLDARRRRTSAAAARAKLPLFSALKGGFNDLIDAVVSRLEASRVHTDCPVRVVEKTEDGYRLRFQSREALEADAVICAQPAWAVAELIRDVDEELAGELGGIPYASSLIVALVYDRETLGTIPEGFGVLVPKREGKRLRALTFVGQKFDHRVPEDKIMLRCFLGGVADEAILSLDDDAVIALVRQELNDILGLDCAPRAVRCFRWNRAMAQYSVGHLERLERIQRRLEALPGLYLAGNAYRGIGVPDCIRSGREAAEAALALV